MIIDVGRERILWPSMILVLLIMAQCGSAADISLEPLSRAREVSLVKSDLAVSDTNLPITDRRYDMASLSLDKSIAVPIDARIIILNPPPRLDYSQYLTFTENQGGWGGCVGRSVIHALSMIKEMEHPYTPDMSFWYLHAIQNQLMNAGATDKDLTKSVLENYGICSEETMPSNYDHAALKYDSNGVAYMDYNTMPQITDAVNQEASLYRIKEMSKPQKIEVEGIKSLLVTYGPLIAGGTMPIVTGNKVDSVAGNVISSDGEFQFTRERAGEWTQTYNGRIINSAEGLRLEGKFTHSGVAGEFIWNATLNTDYPNSAKFWQPSQAAVPVVDLTGVWNMKSNGVDFALNIKQAGGQISGNMTCTSCEGHCVTIVGYDDLAQVFKCLNSYGDTWNGNGFFDMPYDKIAENLDTVKYFVNLPTDRSSSSQAYTARVWIAAPLRNRLKVSIGAEGKDPEVIWDEPNQVYCVDGSSTLCIDVPLPEYAASSWPPEDKQWYVDVTNNGQGTAKIKELTLARLKSNPLCHSVGNFQTETYQAENLPDVPSGSTVRVYIKGTGAQLFAPVMTIEPWYDLQIGQAVVSVPGSNQKVAISGTLTVKSPKGDGPGSGKEIWIYKKADEKCVNKPARWDKIGMAMTDAYGSFSYDVYESGIYAAALLDMEGNVLVSSNEISRELPPQMSIAPLKVPGLIIPEKTEPVEVPVEIKPSPVKTLKRGAAVVRTPLATIEKLNLNS